MTTPKIPDPEALLRARGLVLNGGQEFYPGEPDHVWTFEEDDLLVRVRYTDGAEVLYPVVSFAYLVIKRGKT